MGRVFQKQECVHIKELRLKLLTNQNIVSIGDGFELGESVLSCRNSRN